MSAQTAGAAPETCPSCGQAVTGKFCSTCGATLRDVSCPSCHTPLNPGAKFCHLCGTPLGRSRTRGTPSTVWFAAGAAVVGLVAVLVLAALRGPGSAPSGGAPAGDQSGTASAGGGSAVDLASLSPRERADRLYDRIMRAHERGDTSEVGFFKPMALQAYQMLGELDHDARYHIGLLHALTGEPGAALAQADSMDAGNLMATMLRQRAAIAQGDEDASRRAYSAFLANYDKEIATTRPEYDAHRQLIESFLAEARRAAGGDGS